MQDRWPARALIIVDNGLSCSCIGPISVAAYLPQYSLWQNLIGAYRTFIIIVATCYVYVTPITIITEEQMVWTDECTLITICLRLHTFVELLYEVECVEPRRLL